MQLDWTTLDNVALGKWQNTKTLCSVKCMVLEKELAMYNHIYTRDIYFFVMWLFMRVGRVWAWPHPLISREWAGFLLWVERWWTNRYDRYKIRGWTPKKRIFFLCSISFFPPLNLLYYRRWGLFWCVVTHSCSVALWPLFLECVHLCWYLIRSD